MYPQYYMECFLRPKTQKDPCFLEKHNFLILMLALKQEGKVKMHFTWSLKRREITNYNGSHIGTLAHDLNHDLLGTCPPKI